MRGEEMSHVRQSSPYLSAEEVNPHCMNGRHKDRSQAQWLLCAENLVV